MVARFGCVVDPKLASDGAFQDNLAAPDTQRALEHWTGKARLPVSEAEGAKRRAGAWGREGKEV